VVPHGVRDLKTGTVTTQAEVQIKLPKMPFQRVCFAHEGFAVAGAGGDSTVRVWDAKRGDQLLCLEHGGKCICTPSVLKKNNVELNRGFQSGRIGGASCLVQTG
jgi:hypothetical protein